MNRGRNQHRYKKRAHIRKLHTHLVPNLKKIIVTLHKKCTLTEIKSIHDALHVFDYRKKWNGLK